MENSNGDVGKTRFPFLCKSDNSVFHYFLSPEGKEPSISHRLNICSVEIVYFFEGWLIKALVGTHKCVIISLSS